MNWPQVFIFFSVLQTLAFFAVFQTVDFGMNYFEVNLDREPKAGLEDLISVPSSVQLWSQDQTCLQPESTTQPSAECGGLKHHHSMKPKAYIYFFLQCVITTKTHKTHKQ